MKRVIVIGGNGEVGTAIVKIEKEANNTVISVDKDTSLTSDDMYKNDVMHVCIPYSKKFIEIVEMYGEFFAPELAIIHSTVPVGTTKKIQDSLYASYVVHSPIRGEHPKLYEGIKEFVKYVGGNEESVVNALFHLDSIGIEPYTLGSSDATELSKILSTTYYGWNILFAKEAQEICDKLGLDFDKVYTHPNRTYNDGYTRLGKLNVVRPVLYPPVGKIGGHCVVQNFKLLPGSDLKQMCEYLNEKC